MDFKDKLKKLLNLQSIEEKIDECVSLENDMDLLKAEIDVLAQDFKDRTNDFSKAINAKENTGIVDILTDRQSRFLTVHLKDIGQLKTKYTGLNDKIDSICKSNPEIAKALSEIKAVESFKTIHKAYHSKELTFDKFNNIIKAKTGKIKYADVIVINSKGEILLLQRKDDADFALGLFGLPGGHLDLKETFDEAAIRELQEETGIQVEKLKEVGNYSNNEVDICYYELRTEIEPTITLFEDEHKDYKWISFDDMRPEEMIPNLYDNLEKILYPFKSQIVTIKKAFDLGKMSPEIYNTAMNAVIEKAKKNDNPEIINGKFDIKELKSFSNIFGKEIPNTDTVDTYALYTEAQKSDMDLDDYIESLPLVDIEIEGLIPTQDFVDWDKLSEKLKGKGDKDRHPFIIKKDGENYIFDGHHRLSAAKLNGKKKDKVNLFDEDALNKYTEPQLKELIEEHEKLLPLLEKYADKDEDIKAEFDKQSKELEGYKNDLKNFKKAFDADNPFDYFEKGHKYLRKEPNGKGGFNYIYEEKKEQSNKKFEFNKIESEKLEKDNIHNKRVEIINDLKKHNIESGIGSISVTDYGISGYVSMRFPNNETRQIRISDHSVGNRRFLSGMEYFINLNDNQQKISKIIDTVKKDYDEAIILDKKRSKLFDDVMAKEKMIEERTKVFIERLKKDKKAIFTIDRTYKNLSDFKKDHPTATDIFQKELDGDAIMYYYIDDNNGYGKFRIAPDYFEFLDKNKALD